MLKLLLKPATLKKIMHHACHCIRPVKGNEEIQDLVLFAPSIFDSLNAMNAIFFKPMYTTTSLKEPIFVNYFWETVYKAY